MKTLGWEMASKLSQAVSVNGIGYEGLIPLGDLAHVTVRAEQIESCLREGKSVREAARETGAHERTVFRVRRKMKEQETPDVIRMFLRGSSVEQVAQFTILSRNEIEQLKSRLVAEGQLLSVGGRA